MRVSEALEAVGKSYVPGVAQHYGQMTPDPWQKAHDDLEMVMRMEDPSLTEIAAERFVQDCVRLIGAYLAIQKPKAVITPSDAIHMGSERRVHAHFNRKVKDCFYCYAKENLCLMTDPLDERSAIVVCRDCKESRAS